MAARKFKFVSPGVFLKEIDNSQIPKLPGGVGPVIIGRTRKGPALKPLKVSSFQEFLTIFGETVPGNQGSDPWRAGNGLLATAYAPYAAQAYLAAAIQSPVTVIRLAGIAGDDALEDTGDAKPGWTATRGATGLFAFPSASNSQGLTGSLVGILYHEGDANEVVFGIKGAPNNNPIHRDPSGSSTKTDGAVTVETYTNQGVLTDPDTDGTFSLLLNLSASSGAMTNWTKKISFTPGSKNYIRDVLNTNPVKTNTFISAIASGTLSDKYFLGETFEEEFQRVSASAGSSGVALMTARLTNMLNDFKSSNHQASPGQTGWIFGQHDGFHEDFAAINQQKLFRVISLHDGESPSRDTVIRIENIRIPSEGATDPYGTFAVVVLKVGSTRLEEVERFDGCNLNPNSQNFVARKVGNQYFVWSSAEKRNKVYGSYPNVSDHIRIDMDPDVLEKGPDNPAAVPFGFFGPIVPVTPSITVTGSGGAGVDGTTTAVGGDAVFVNQAARAAGINDLLAFKYPEFPVVVSASLQDPVFGVTAHKLSYNALGATSEKATLNSGFVDYCRRPSEYSSILGDHIKGIPTANQSRYSFTFTLDDVILTGAADLTANTDLSSYSFDKLAYESGSRVVGTSATAKNDVIDLTREIFDAFQMPLVGGFEGVNIKEADPFNMRTVSSTATTANSYAYASIDRAIELIKDPESLEMNLACMPGVTNEALTTKLVETCESRADALAIIDLPDVYKPPFQTRCDKFEERLGTTPAKAAKALTARQLNSSYGATYYPWVKVRDSIYTRDVWVPPSVVALGVMAYTEERNEVWFAPAGFNRGGLNEGNAGLAVLQVTEQLLSKHRDTLYEANINPIASFVTEGLVVFGQKTLQTTQSALDRINVRRLLIFVKKEVSRISNQLLFDQNLPATWNRFKGQVVPMLESVKTRLGLADFKVILDETTTTPDLVDRNIMYAKIFLKPARAIEFIAVDFVITNTGASFDD